MTVPELQQHLQLYYNYNGANDFIRIAMIQMTILQ